MEADKMATLVLSRKPSEKIHIGDNIILEVKECRSGRTKIAVTAPRSTGVWRGEIHEAMHAAALPVTGQH